MSDRDAGAKWIERVLGATVPSAVFQRPAAAQSEDDPGLPLPENRAAPRGKGDRDVEEKEDERSDEQRDFQEKRAIAAMYGDIFGSDLADEDVVSMDYWHSRLKSQGISGTRDEMLQMQERFRESRGQMIERSDDREAKGNPNGQDSPVSDSGKGKEKDFGSVSDSQEKGESSPRRALPPWPGRGSGSPQRRGPASPGKYNPGNSDDGKTRLTKRVELMFDQEMDEDELDSCLSIVETNFGQAVGEEVFRDISLRRVNGKAILGGEVQSAIHKAVTMVSPLASLKAREETGNTRLALAQKGSASADEEKHEAEGNLVNSKRRVALLRSNAAGNAARQAQDERLQTAASENSSRAREELTAATAEAQQAAAARALYERSLQESFAPGEDAVRLEGQCNVAQKRVSKAAGMLDDAEKALRQAQGRQKLAEHRAGQDSSDRGDLQEALAAKRALAAAEAAVADAKETLKTEQAKLAKVQDRLALLNGGPALRRVQALTDNLGDHPELAQLIEQRKPSTTGNKAQALAKGTGKLAIGAIPVVGLGVTFAGAILSENQERRLNATTSQLPDWPMAEAMTGCLSRSKETEKNKKGMAGAVGMVFTAATLPVAGGVGVLAGPMAAAAFGSVGGHVAVTAGGKAAGMATAQGAVALAKKGTPGRPIRGGGEAEQPDDVAWPGLPEGSALPTIPGDGGDSFDLNDPPVGLALLEFLGPAQNSRGGRLDEERRLRLRQEMFGSGPDLDLVKGQTEMTDTDRLIQDELDQGSEQRPNAAKADKLRLLYIALGWLDSARLARLVRRARSTFPT
jgi:hypothetical protein